MPTITIVDTLPSQASSGNRWRTVRAKLLGSTQLRFSLRNYGAPATGNDWYNNFVRAAASAVSAGGGIIELPGGSYGLSAPFVLPNTVSIEAASHQSVRIYALEEMEYLITAREAVSVTNYGGFIKHIQLDGADLAARGLDLGVCVEKVIEGIFIKSCTDAGLVLRGTQNCNFDRIICENNGADNLTTGGGLRLNHAASNNIFKGLELNANHGHAMVIADNDTIDDFPDAYFASELAFVPSGNKWYGGIIGERDEADVTSQVYIRAGVNNLFDGCAIQSSYTGHILFEITGEDVGALVVSYLNRLHNITTMGTAAGATFLKSRGGYLTRVHNRQVDNAGTIFDLGDTTAEVVVTGNNRWPASYTNFYTTTGAKGRTELIYSDVFEPGAIAKQRLVAGLDLDDLTNFSNYLEMNGVGTGSPPNIQAKSTNGAEDVSINILGFNDGGLLMLGNRRNSFLWHGGDDGSPLRLYALGTSDANVGIEFNPKGRGGWGGASSAWDAPNLSLGGYKFWVDAAGKWRMKYGLPTGDTDGTALGGDVSSIETSSSDKQVALFHSTDGKQIEKDTQSGIAKLTSGVLSTLTDPLPVANGGTGSTSAADARTALGLGTMAQYAENNYYTKSAADTLLAAKATAGSVAADSIVLAKRTSGGSEGYITVSAEGVIISYLKPT